MAFPPHQTPFASEQEQRFPELTPPPALSFLSSKGLAEQAGTVGKVKEAPFSDFH